jgi:hypothetical protein
MRHVLVNRLVAATALVLLVACLVFAAIQA